MITIFHMLHSDKMKVLKIVFILLVALCASIAAIFFWIGNSKEKPGGIYVDTNPSSDVYINGSLVGKSPYTGLYKVGEIVLKLVPISSDQSLIAYETRITLVPGIQTIVRREFGNTEDTSSGDVISFDRTGGTEAGIIIVSTPENAQVSIDGLPQGFAPFKISGVSSSEHQITVKAPGYTDRIMTVKTQTGYRLSLFAKLSKSVEKTQIPTPVPETRTYVQILSTPTGFLRVRTAPGTAGEEIAEVKTGDKFPFLDEDVATGWIEIQYEASAPGLPDGITGWVSGQYTKKFTQQTEESTSSGVLNQF